MRILAVFMLPARRLRPSGWPGRSTGGQTRWRSRWVAWGASVAFATGLVSARTDDLVPAPGDRPGAPAVDSSELESTSGCVHPAQPRAVGGPWEGGPQGDSLRGRRPDAVPPGAIIAGSLAASASLGQRAARASLDKLDLGHRRYPRRKPNLGELDKTWRSKLERWNREVTDPEPKVQEAALRQALDGLLQMEARYARIDPKTERQREQEDAARSAAHALDWSLRQWLQQEAHAGTWLTHLALSPTANIKQRARALELLVAARHKDAETLLIHQANQPGNELRPFALAAMAHWPRLALDRHLARTYAQAPGDPEVIRLLLHRVQEHGPLHPEAEQDLTPTLVQQLVQDDWQVAGHALLLLERFEPEARFEALMAAMPTVAQGVREGKARWRILADIAEQLREITGRSMGNDPRPWLTFYERYHAGQLPLRVDQDAEPGGISRTQFFGIGQVSDHVTFVIDTSGSMEAPFGTTGHSAYEEAVDQLVGYLRGLGDQAWFRVVTFNDRASVLVSLRQADAGTMRGLKKTLLRKEPGGGTALGSGIRKALRVNRSKKGPKGAHASDSIIVLCDGATMEGRRWAEDLLAEPDFPRGLRFHCVQIGSSPAAAMKVLANRTGGRFVRR